MYHSSVWSGQNINIYICNLLRSLLFWDVMQRRLVVTAWPLDW